MISTWLFYFFILLLPFGQLTKLPIGWPAINIYAHDFVVVLLIFVFVIKKVFKKEKLFLPKAAQAVFIFSFCCLLSLVFNFSNWPLENLTVAFLYLLRWIFYAFLYLFVFDLTKRKRLVRTNTIQLLTIVSLAASIFGLLQYVFLPDIRDLTFLGWDPHYFRVVGTFLDPGFTGLIYVLGIILLLVKFSRCKSILHSSLFIILYSALALTYARSAYLAYLWAMAVIAWYKKSTRFFLAVFLGGILTVLLLPRPGGEGVRLERKSTVLSRIESYKKGLTIAFDNPVFGVGFNTLRYAQKEYGFLDDNWLSTHSGAGTDSSLLFVLATTGTVGFASYLYLLGRLAVLNLPSQKFKKIKLISFVSFLAVLIHSFFNNSLFYPWIMNWLWILFGVSESE